MSPSAGTATALDNTQLLITMNAKLGALDERTKNTQSDVQELKNAFERHREVTEARTRKFGDKLSHMRTEWKVAIVLVTFFAKEIMGEVWKRMAH